MVPHVFSEENLQTTWKYEIIKDPVTGETRENVVGTNKIGIMYAMCVSESEKKDKTDLFIGFRGYGFKVTKNELENRLALKIDENKPHIMSGNEFLGGTLIINSENIVTVFIELINAKNILVRLTDDKNVFQTMHMKLNDFMPNFIKTACWKSFIKQ